MPGTNYWSWSWHYLKSGIRSHYLQLSWAPSGTWFPKGTSFWRALGSRRQSSHEAFEESHMYDCFDFWWISNFRYGNRSNCQVETNIAHEFRTERFRTSHAWTLFDGLQSKCTTRPFRVTEAQKWKKVQASASVTSSILEPMEERVPQPAEMEGAWQSSQNWWFCVLSRWQHHTLTVASSSYHGIESRQWWCGTCRQN